MNITGAPELDCSLIRSQDPVTPDSAACTDKTDIFPTLVRVLGSKVFLKREGPSSQSAGGALEDKMARFGWEHRALSKSKPGRGG